MQSEVSYVALTVRPNRPSPHVEAEAQDRVHETGPCFRDRFMRNAIALGVPVHSTVGLTVYRSRRPDDGRPEKLMECFVFQEY
jgi:hypothetical protein